MKVLLVTNVPPGPSLATAVVTDRLCRMLAPDTLACITIADPRLGLMVPEDLAWMPTLYLDRPREHWRVLPGPAGGLYTHLQERWSGAIRVPRLVERAVGFGMDWGADRIWCVLDGQTLIRVAFPLAQALDVPLHAQVWDAPMAALQAKELDQATVKRVMLNFDAAMCRSQRVAVVSGPMADAYTARYGAECVVVPPGLDEGCARDPAATLPQRDTIWLGLSGQLYAPGAWQALVSGLAERNWQLGGRAVRLRMCGPRQPELPAVSDHVDWLGWLDLAGTVDHLARCDLVYIPYWFDPAMGEPARLCFPSKLVTSLAAGRPVVLHGPADSAPARFLREHGAGLCIDSTSPAVVAREIEDLLTEPERQRALARQGRIAFGQYLSLDVMRDAFLQFLA